jgi:hypothetical protein
MTYVPLATLSAPMPSTDEYLTSLINVITCSSNNSSSGDHASGTSNVSTVAPYPRIPGCIEIVDYHRHWSLSSLQRLCDTVTTSPRQRSNYTHGIMIDTQQPLIIDDANIDMTTSDGHNECMRRYVR